MRPRRCSWSISGVSASRSRTPPGRAASVHAASSTGARLRNSTSPDMHRKHVLTCRENDNTRLHATLVHAANHVASGLWNSTYPGMHGNMLKLAGRMANPVACNLGARCPPCRLQAPKCSTSLRCRKDTTCSNKIAAGGEASTGSTTSVHARRLPNSLATHIPHTFASQARGPAHPS